MKPQLSIIIINYNTFELTCNCIDSIYRETKNISFEIILVDNASAECDPELFLEKFPEIVLIKNPRNEGFGRANNKGMKIAKGEYFLLLNSDTEIINNTIGKAWSFVEKNKKVDLYSCAQKPSINSPYFFNNYKNLKLEFSIKWIFLSQPIFHIAKIRKYTKLDEKIHEKQQVNIVSGAFMLLKRIVFEKTGGFDPDFFLYYEETEWCSNRIKRDFFILYDPNVFFIHKVGSSSDAKKSTLSKNIHFFVSGALAYYKTSLINYIFFIFFECFINLPQLILLSISAKKSQEKDYYKQKLIILCKSIPHILFTVPSYSRKFNSNKEPLNLYKKVLKK